MSIITITIDVVNGNLIICFLHKVYLVYVQDKIDEGHRLAYFFLTIFASQIIGSSNGTAGKEVCSLNCQHSTPQSSS